MKCTFVVGQKVVCIVSLWNATGLPDDELPAHGLPREGGIYTVREIGISPALGNEAAIALMEIAPNHWFRHTGFRPLTERPTDISIFTRMLNSKTPETVP